MRFLGTCLVETREPIKMKFCTIDKVGKATPCATNGMNRFAGNGPKDRSNVTSKLFLPYLTLPYLTLFVFLYASTAQTDKPICTNDGSNDMACRKEVPCDGRIDTELHFGVKTPNFLTEMSSFQPTQFSRKTVER
jgi:hypothetical protein